MWLHMHKTNDGEKEKKERNFRINQLARPFSWMSEVLKHEKKITWMSNYIYSIRFFRSIDELILYLVIRIPLMNISLYCCQYPSINID